MEPGGIIGLARVSLAGAKHAYDRLRMRLTLKPSEGSYQIRRKGCAQPLERVSVEIDVKSGNLFVINMDMTPDGRGHATAKIEMNRRTLEGRGSYRHLIPDEEPLFGDWHLAVRDKNQIDVTTRYAVYGGPEEVQQHVWQKIPDQDYPSCSSAR
jgi:hypothetical protein